MCQIRIAITQRKKLLRALIGVCMLVPTGAQAAYYEFSASAPGTVSIDGGAPSAVGTITLTGYGDTANATYTNPYPYPYGATAAWPLDALSFTAPGITGWYQNPGVMGFGYSAMVAGNFGLGGIGASYVLSPPRPQWVLDPYPFTGAVTVFTVSTPSTARTLTSGHTVLFSYVARSENDQWLSFFATPATAPVIVSPVVPEPATSLLALFGLASLALWRTRT